MSKPPEQRAQEYALTISIMRRALETIRSLIRDLPRGATADEIDRIAQVGLSQAAQANETEQEPG